MEKIKKGYSLKIASLLVITLLLNSAVYAVNLSNNKTHVRLPVGHKGTYDHMRELNTLGRELKRADQTSAMSTRFDIDISREAMPPTNEVGKLRNWESFCSVKVRRGTTQYILYIPNKVITNMNDDEVRAKTKDFVDLYDKAVKKFSEIGRSVTENCIVRYIFAETDVGYPHAKVYGNRAIEVFTHVFGFEKGATQKCEETLLHEIGHGLVGITLGGWLSKDPRTIAIEEGIADYIAGVRYVDGHDGEGGDHRFSIPQGTKSHLSGLSQLDVDASIWGASIATEHFLGAYFGKTHHSFGIEFVHAFIDIFGKEKLYDFLEKLKWIKPALPLTEKDLLGKGSEWIKDALVASGHDEEKIDTFRMRLFQLLMQNVFNEGELSFKCVDVNSLSATRGCQ